MSAKDDAIVKKVARYRTLRARREKLDSEIKELQSDIIEYLEEAGVGPSEPITIGKATVKFAECSRSSLDKSLLVPVLGQDLSQFEKVSYFQRLYIK